MLVFSLLNGKKTQIVLLQLVSTLCISGRLPDRLLPDTMNQFYHSRLSKNDPLHLQCFLQQSDPSFAHRRNHTFTFDQEKPAPQGLRSLDQFLFIYLFFGGVFFALNPTKSETPTFPTCFLTTNALWYHPPKNFKQIYM